MLSRLIAAAALFTCVSTGCLIAGLCSWFGLPAVGLVLGVWFAVGAAMTAVPEILRG